MIYLTPDDVILVNQTQIFRFGGYYILQNSNVQNMSSFQYMLEIVKSIYSGHKLFYNRYNIAYAYSFYIICDHIFNDGNKRTGIHSALIFLEKNGSKTKNNVTDQEIVSFALAIENNSIDKIQIEKWYKAHTFK